MSEGVSVREADLRRDVERLVTLNNEAVPAVNTLDADAFRALARLGEVRVAADSEGQILGVVVTLGPGQPYDSLNYAWFLERYENFLYIDRVVVAPEAKGRGIGRRLYEDVFARACTGGRPHVLSEVNVDPPNPDSLAFHTRLGFEKVAERLNEREGKVVAMMVRPVV